MPTVARSIEVTSNLIADVHEGELLDVIVQNLSANNIYVGSDQNVTIASGIRIVANGYWANDQRAEPVWLISDGAGSDARVTYVAYRKGERSRR